MSTTITGKLTKAANEFQAGESIGFGLRLGVRHYDRKTKQKEWTNYSCVVFAKASAQIDYYRQVLQIGSIVEVTATHEKIDVYEGSNGPSYTIELINAQIGNVFSTGDQPARPQAQQTPQEQHQAQHQRNQQIAQQQAHPQAKHQASQQQDQQGQPAPGGYDDFMDDIPFAQHERGMVC